MLTAQELAHSLRQIAEHAKPGLIVSGEQRMVIELSQERVNDLYRAAALISASEIDAGPDTEGMGL